MHNCTTGGESGPYGWKVIKTDIDILNTDKFNRRYYVAATDEIKARNFLGTSAVKILEKTKGVHIQVNERQVILQFENDLDKEQATTIVKILLTVGAD